MYLVRDIRAKGMAATAEVRRRRWVTRGFPGPALDGCRTGESGRVFTGSRGPHGKVSQARFRGWMFPSPSDRQLVDCSHVACLGQAMLSGKMLAPLADNKRRVLGRRRPNAVTV